jgi:hypothetical protein
MDFTYYVIDKYLNQIYIRKNFIFRFFFQFSCMFIEITSDIYFKALDQVHIGCSFKFPVKVGVEESIVNAPRITDHGLVVLP